MNIAFDVGPVRAQPTGVGVYAAAMSRALSNVLAPGQLRLIGRREDAAGLPENVPSRGRSKGPYPVWVQVSSEADARKVGADVVHYSDGIVPVVGHRASVLTVHDLSAIRQWRTHRAPRWLRIPLVFVSPRLAKLIIVPSRATADELVSVCRVAPSRIEIIPYAPPERLGPADDDTVASVLTRHGLELKNYIVALGTIEPRKNHLRLVRAFEHAVSTGAVNPDVQLVIIGKSGWGSSRVMRAIDVSEVARQIRVLGFLDEGDLPPILTGACAVAYVSIYEGFGLPVVEAMACGAATVTSNISSMPEVAGDAAFLVDPYDVEDIARGLVEAVEASRTRSESVRAISLAQAANFTWARAARLVADAYSTRF